MVGKTGLPFGNLLQFAIEHGPVNIVDLPSYKMAIFHSYVNVYWRVMMFQDWYAIKNPCLHPS